MEEKQCLSLSAEAFFIKEKIMSGMTVKELIQELSKYDESDMVRIEVYSSSNDANAKLTVGKNRDTLLKDNDFDEY